MGEGGGKEDKKKGNSMSIARRSPEHIKRGIQTICRGPKERIKVDKDDWDDVSVMK